VGHGYGRLARAGAAALVIGLSTVGCGDDGPTEREYALTDTLCGLNVPRDLYDPLFPPGSDLSVEDFTGMPYMTSGYRCLVSVDDEQVILAETRGDDGFQSFLMNPGNDDLEEEYAIADGTPVEGEYEAMVWPGFAIAGTSCEPGTSIHSFTIGIQAEYPEDDEESVRALSELIQPFMRAAVEQSVCTPGSNPNSDYAADR
jgi:hypothetical protein